MERKPGRGEQPRKQQRERVVTKWVVNLRTAPFLPLFLSISTPCLPANTRFNSADEIKRNSLERTGRGSSEEI